MCVYYRYVEGVVHRLEKEIRNIINQESDPDKETPAEREKVLTLLSLLVQKVLTLLALLEQKYRQMLTPAELEKREKQLREMRFISRDGDNGDPAKGNVCVTVCV